MNQWILQFANYFGIQPGEGKEILTWAFTIVLTAIVAGAAQLGLKFVATRFRKITSRTRMIWDDVLADQMDRVKTSVIAVMVFYALIKLFGLAPQAHSFFRGIVVAFAVYQVAVWGHHIIATWRQQTLERRIEADQSASAALGMLYVGVQAVFFTAVVLIGLSNLGVDIGALLAGLGVGGIAIALAAQNVLGDLLASLSIVLDKPFVVGDYITVDEDQGTVENIGIKTTRLRALSGEELVFSNKDLLESRVRNYKRMQQRRIELKIGVVYSTTAEQLEQIPVWIKGFVDGMKDPRFERCHFAGFGDSALNIELTYWVTNSDYNLHMDLQQELLLKIYRKFGEAKVDFAFPTRTVVIENLPEVGLRRPADSRADSNGDSRVRSEPVPTAQAAPDRTQH